MSPIVRTRQPGPGMWNVAAFKLRRLLPIVQQVDGVRAGDPAIAAMHRDRGFRALLHELLAVRDNARPLPSWRR